MRSPQGGVGPVLAVIRLVDQQPKLSIILLAIGSSVLLSVLDRMTGHYALVGFLYLVPITFATWHAGPRWGILVAVVCAALGAVATGSTGDTNGPIWSLSWNTLVRLAVFLLATLLLSTLRAAQDQETVLARTDALTGAANHRWFREQLDREIVRCRRYRHPFTVIYSDLDNFKTVNDRLGHAAGDTLLREVVASMKDGVRDTDVVARLGGDEFAILLPETGQAAGSLVAHQLRRRVLEAMQRHAWPVCGSFGVVTCVDPPASAEALLDLADGLMYAVKREGKGGVRHAILATNPASHQAPQVSIVEAEVQLQKVRRLRSWSKPDPTDTTAVPRLKNKIPPTQNAKRDEHLENGPG